MKYVKSYAFVTLSALVLGLGVANAIPKKPVKKPTSSRICVDVNHLQTKMIIAPDQVLLRENSKTAVIIKLSPPCQNMSDIDQVGFIINGTSQLCSRTDMRILYRRHTEPAISCLIREVIPVTGQHADE